MKLRSIDADALLALLHDLDGESGASEAACDQPRLEIALLSPLQLAASADVDVAAIAASYAAAIMELKPFGTRSTQAALLAMGLFLYVNGWRLSAAPEVVEIVMRRMAAGEIDENGLANWLRANL